MANTNNADVSAEQERQKSLKELQQAFVTGAIPTQEDYAALIARADIGRIAVGLDEQMKQLVSKTGLEWTTGQPLKIKLAYQDKKNVSGLILSTCGMAVKPGPGIDVDDRGVRVRTTGALITNNDGVSVNLGPGLMLDGDKEDAIALKLDLTGGLTLNDRAELGIKLAPHSGLVTTVKGLGVNINSDFLTVDTEGALTLTEEALDNAVQQIGGALSAALKAVTEYVVDKRGNPSEFNGSKVAQRLQSVFITALGQATNAMQSPKSNNLKGWARSISMALSESRSSGQGDTVTALLRDAQNRHALETKPFLNVDGGSGIFLPVRNIEANTNPDSSPIDCGGCIVVLQNNMTTVATQLYVGHGGYYLDFTDAQISGRSVGIADIKSIVLLGCKNGKSQVYQYTAPK